VKSVSPEMNAAILRLIADYKAGRITEAEYNRQLAGFANGAQAELFGASRDDAGLVSGSSDSRLDACADELDKIGRRLDAYERGAATRSDGFFDIFTPRYAEEGEARWASEREAGARARDQEAAAWRAAQSKAMSMSNNEAKALLRQLDNKGHGRTPSEDVTYQALRAREGRVALKREFASHRNPYSEFDSAGDAQAQT
jgi:hypothetical protein